MIEASFSSGASLRESKKMSITSSGHVQKVFLFYAFLFIILLLSENVFGQEKPLSCQVVSFIPEFCAFWQTAKEEPLERKIELWETLFESKHSEFYRQVIYEKLEGEELTRFKEKKLKDFLSSLKDEDVKRMRVKNDELIQLIPQATDALGKTIQHSDGTVTHYIIPSLNTSRGACRPYKAEMIVFYGLEFISQMESQDYIKAIIAHETFHVLHFRNIAPLLWRKYAEEANIVSLVEGEGPLFFVFIEGLAVYTTEKIYPGIPRPGIIEKNVPLYEKNFLAYTREFLKDLKDFNHQKYRKYFIEPSNDPLIPDKFGFWLAYKVIQSMCQEYSVEEMMKWCPERAVHVVWDKTKNICTDLEKNLNPNNSVH